MEHQMEALVYRNFPADIRGDIPRLLLMDCLNEFVEISYKRWIHAHHGSDKIRGAWSNISSSSPPGSQSDSFSTTAYAGRLERHPTRLAPLRLDIPTHGHDAGGDTQPNSSRSATKAWSECYDDPWPRQRSFLLSDLISVAWADSAYYPSFSPTSGQLTYRKVAAIVPKSLSQSHSDIRSALVGRKTRY